MLARAINPETGESVLWDYKVTAFIKDLEWNGYDLTFSLPGRRYRTYDCFVADEVRGMLNDPKNFKNSLLMLIPFVIQDRNLITSRWPLDAPLYAKRFVDMVAGEWLICRTVLVANAWLNAFAFLLFLYVFNPSILEEYLYNSELLFISDILLRKNENMCTQ